MSKLMNASEVRMFLKGVKNVNGQIFNIDFDFINALYNYIPQTFIGDENFFDAEELIRYVSYQKGKSLGLILEASVPMVDGTIDYGAEDPDTAEFVRKSHEF